MREKKYMHAFRKLNSVMGEKITTVTEKLRLEHVLNSCDLIMRV